MNHFVSLSVCKSVSRSHFILKTFHSTYTFYKYAYKIQNLLHQVIKEFFEKNFISCLCFLINFISFILYILYLKIQGDQLYMAVLFRYLVGHDLFSVLYCTVHYRNFVQGTRICLCVQVVIFCSCCAPPLLFKP